VAGIAAYVGVFELKKRRVTPLPPEQEGLAAHVRNRVKLSGQSVIKES
jgi:hypothetical protein